VAAAGALSAQPPSAGSEFQVNSYVLGGQRAPRVASRPDGGFVVVWQSQGSPGSDTDGYSVQAQRFDAVGQPASGQFQVNDYTTHIQQRPDVAFLAGGAFVVVWDSLGSDGTDSDFLSVQARLFHSDGTPQGGQFQVNTYTTSTQSMARVAGDASGHFVVVWSSEGSPGSDSSNFSVQARRYDANGTPLGDQFQVNTYTTLSQCTGDVAMGDAGNFVIVWQSRGSDGSDQSGYSVQARRFAADGAPQGPQFQVNAYTTGGQRYPAVACDAACGFVVAWDSYGSFGSDTDSYSVQARRYSAAGVPQSGQFQVNGYTTGHQRIASVAADRDRDFEIVWQSEWSNRDGDGDSVQSRWYAPDGAPRGSELQINHWSTSDQERPDVASDALGDVVIVWQSLGSAGSDHDGFSVQARRYDGLFRDGFERGDALRWSDVVP
jgi:hypothetical protein